MLDPLTLSLVSGAASSLLGGNQMTAEQRRQLQLQNSIAQRLNQYSQGVPGSDPQEMAAQAQAQAQLGEQQLQQRNQAYSALGANQGSGNLGDFLLNLGGQQTAQKMSLDQQHLMNALAQRRQALLQASQVGMGAASLANQQGPPNQLPQMFSQVAQGLAYQAALKQQNKPAAGASLPANYWGGGNQPVGIAGNGSGNLGGIHWSQPGQGGLTMPGNEPYGANSAANQARQASGLGYSLFTTPNGLRF